MELLAMLLKKSQEQLKNDLYDHLKYLEMDPLYEDGFIYAKGKIPVLLVAHMDTVFPIKPKKIYYNKAQDIIFNPEPNNGLGGDDRCGVYAILKLLKKYRPYVLFTEDEEIGCVGAIKATKKLLIPDIKYIIEFDRRGENDCVFYDCGNETFMNYVESFGFKTARGSYSDIVELSNAWDVASVNLSCGYYHEHTPNEYVVFSQLEQTIKKADLMLSKIKEAPRFEYQKICYDYDFDIPTYNLWYKKLFLEKKDGNNNDRN